MLPKVILAVSCLCIARAAFVINAPDDVSNDVAEVESAVRACGAVECNQHCRRMGYARGVCIGTYCQCRMRSAPFVRPENLNEESISEQDSDGPVNDETPERNQENEIQDENENEHDNDDNLAEDFSVDQTSLGDNSERAARACSNSNCNRFCRARGFARGRCISAKVCRCYRYRVTLRENKIQEENEVENDSDADLSDDFSVDQTSSGDNSERAARACNNANCNRFCRALSYARGTCISASVCRCYRNRVQSRDNEVSESENEIPSSADAVESIKAEESDRLARACDAKICNDNCRAMRYDRGICIISRCQCMGRPIWFKGISNEAENDIKISRTADAENGLNALLEENLVEADEDLASPSLRLCNLQLCDLNCRRLGFLGGVCNNGRCICRIQRSEMSPAIPIPSVASDEEVSSRSLRDCNLSWCEQNCRRIGFPGGACVNGRCKCDILRSALPPAIPIPDEENLADSSLGKCIDYQCAETCRRMNYRGGLCTGDSCICFM